MTCYLLLQRRSKRPTTILSANPTCRHANMSPRRKHRVPLEATSIWNHPSRSSAQWSFSNHSEASASRANTPSEGFHSYSGNGSETRFLQIVKSVAHADLPPRWSPPTLQTLCNSDSCDNSTAKRANYIRGLILLHINPNTLGAIKTVTKIYRYAIQAVVYSDGSLCISISKI